MTSHTSPEQVVRDVVATADERRRSRSAARRLARLAPAVAGASALLALLSRLAAAPPVLPLGAIALGLVALGVTAGLVRRRRIVSDRQAARLDDAAELGGELRSAYWFAQAPSRDAWADHHLELAAVRVAAVDWKVVYQPFRTGRAWAATVVLVTAAVGLSIVGPSGRLTLRAPAAAGAATAGAAALSEDLRRRLELLLAAITAGTVPIDEARAKVEEIGKLVAKLDPALSEKLAKLAKDLAERGKADGLGELDRQKSAADAATTAGLPEDVRWALEDMASRLANADARQRQTNSENPSASRQTGEDGRGSDQASLSQASVESGMQMIREAASDIGDAQMLLGGGAMGGDSRPGAGGNSGTPPSGPDDPKIIALALRRELIEASADMLGSNVAVEDIRRKTEQGRSVLGFSGVAAPAMADRSRAKPAPPVPEARLPLVQSYFVRPAGK